MSVRSAYDQELLNRGYQADPAQLRAVDALERCAQEWAAYQESIKSPLRFLKKKPELPRGNSGFFFKNRSGLLMLS